MDDSNCSQTCRIKTDLIGSFDKLVYIVENWSELLQPEAIMEMAESEMRCGLCLIEIIIKDLEEEKYHCPNRDIIRLVMLRMCLENSLEINRLIRENLVESFSNGRT